jgi:hypothetical protein
MALAVGDDGLRAGECSPPARTGATRRAVRGHASGKEDHLRRLRKIEGRSVACRR